VHPWRVADFRSRVGNCELFWKWKIKSGRFIPGFAFANLLIALSPRMRIRGERGLLVAAASSSEGGWKAGWRENICRPFGFFMSLILLIEEESEPEFSCNSMEMKFLISLRLHGESDRSVPVSACLVGGQGVSRPLV